tara:strand:- start:125 stop:823 length:699 start_codon:yes stop_codon:yes gene_type:complete
MKKKNLFDDSKSKTVDKLKNFSKYVPRQSLARFLVYYELFKKQLGIKGSIVECGVHQGGGVMSWAKLSTTLEPYNFHRKIIGFDTFSGFPKISEIDKKYKYSKKGLFSEKFNTYNELRQTIKEYDKNRYIKHLPKIELVKGDAVKTIPKYVKDNKHLIISLLFLDFDIFEPTAVALKYFLPRMPRGSILAFDEINNENWPGETMALLEKHNINKLKIKNFPSEPHMSFLEIK